MAAGLSWLRLTPVIYQAFQNVVILTWSQPKAKGLQACFVGTAKFPSCRFCLNLSKLSLWSSCCLISSLRHVLGFFFFLFLLSFAAPSPVEQRHCQPILSFSCIIQCTVQWVSGRIKSEQTTAWNKCWCTVPNTPQSVLVISRSLSHYWAQNYPIGGFSSLFFSLAFS